MTTQGSSQKHHVNPQAYLKGFVAYRKPDMIWRYQRRKSYEPGKSSTSNPRLMSVKEAGVLFQYYSFDRVDGTHDLDSVEKELARYEGYGNPILHRLTRLAGNGGLCLTAALSPTEKAMFASYVVLSLRRTPRSMARYQRIWQHAPEDSPFAQWKDVILGLRQYVMEGALGEDYPFDRCISEYQRALRSYEDASDERAVQVRMLNEFRRAFRNYPVGTAGEFLAVSERYMAGEMPAEFRVTGMADFTIGRLIRRMRWVFLLAPPGSHFVSCDNPVVITEDIGLKQTRAEITFPLSSGLALYATWHSEVPECFTAAPTAVLGEINGRTIANATNWVYACYDSPTIASLVAQPRGSSTSIHQLLTGRRGLHG